MADCSAPLVPSDSLSPSLVVHREVAPASIGDVHKNINPSCSAQKNRLWSDPRSRRFADLVPTGEPRFPEDPAAATLARAAWRRTGRGGPATSPDYS